MALAARSLLYDSIKLSTVLRASKHTLTDLPYDYNALEPTISAEIMQLHHQKHHNDNVTNLNVIEYKLSEAMAKHNHNEVIALQPGYKFNGGGHINHFILWQMMSKDGGEPSKDLDAALKRDFGSLDLMQKKLSALTVAVQGNYRIDVWEHAYYLQYKNVRPDYVNATWKVANLSEISKRYAQVLKNVKY